MIRRYSKQRELIYQTIISTKEHPTAENVYSTLKESNPSLSLGTVYRNIRQLEEAGMIIKIPNTGTSERYDGSVHEHSHFICDVCGDVLDVEDASLNSRMLTFASKKDFTVSRMSLTLHGVCAKCKKQ